MQVDSGYELDKYFDNQWQLSPVRRVNAWDSKPLAALHTVLDSGNTYY